MKRIDTECLVAIQRQAGADARLRTNYNLHESLDDPVQRLCNAMEPGTYVRPHRHATPPKWELLVILSGHLAALCFDEQGRVLERVEIQAGGPAYLLELPALAWHTVAALVPGTVVLEVKPGPYAPLAAEAFAPWAPAPGDAEARAVTAWFAGARVGERWRTD